MIRIRDQLFSTRGASLCLLAIVFWWLAFPVAYRMVVPPSWYLDVRSIYVADAPMGTSPAVILDRDINRNFIGDFEAAVRAVDAVDGTIWTYCQPGERGDIPYIAGRPYPGRNLDWWLGSPPAAKCPIIPGKYQLRIEWTINAFFGLIQMHMTRESQPFTIYDPGTASFMPMSAGR